MTQTTHTYTEEQRQRAQEAFDRTREAITHELDVQASQLPAIYQEALFFCKMARAGRVISGSTTWFIEENNLECGCYLGVTAHFDAAKANQYAKLLREALSRGTTPIESYLFRCSEVETYPVVKDNTLQPIPWGNPALTFLVELIEQHLTEHG
jgi:hypothetical protein